MPVPKNAPLAKQVTLVIASQLVSQMLCCSTAKDAVSGKTLDQAPFLCPRPDRHCELLVHSKRCYVCVHYTVTCIHCICYILYTVYSAVYIKVACFAVHQQLTGSIRPRTASVLLLLVSGTAPTSCTNCSPA